MKKIYPLLIAALLMVNLVIAQAPQGLNYQAIVRNVAGHPLLTGSHVSFRFNIHDVSATGTIVFTETQSDTTNQFGLVTLKIGAVNSLTIVNWGNGAKYLQVELDATGGNNFTDMGTSQLLSVPYALFAGNSAAGPMGPTGLQGNTGAAGATGLNGAMGLTGAIGVTGATGPAGLQGATGTTGAQGVGVTGPTGLAGATGRQGDAGNTGLTGNNGATGVTGANGATGNDGVAGITGTTGATGLNGAPGPSGNDGIAGLTGPTGNNGNDGVNGVTGATGLDGAPGADGAIGATGPAGTGAFSHYVGQLWGGGIIVSVWIDAGGAEHGLIASLTDIADSVQWSNVTTIAIGPNAQDQSNGIGNTTSIFWQFGQTTSAALLCINYSGGGYNDWYLPAIWELQQCYNSAMIVNNVLGNANGFRFGTPNPPFGIYYWSSTEFSATEAWMLNFSYGTSGPVAKSTLDMVRAVRRY